MTEKELIEIARRCAVNCSEHHSYMPSGPTSAACFWPHKWVLEAMAEAIKVALLAAGEREGKAQPISDYMMDLVDRLGSEADAVDPRAWTHLLVYARPHMTLDKPAQVSGTRFGTGVKWSTVIGAAQRYHEFMQTPEKEALRIENARAFLEGIHSAAGASEGQAEPVAIYHGNGIIDCGDAGHHNIELLKMIPAGAKLFKDPSGKIAVLREAMKGAEVIANAAGAEIAALRERIAEKTAQVDDLRMLVQRLVHSLNKASPGNDLGAKALDYLMRNGLGASLLREDSDSRTPGWISVKDRLPDSVGTYLLYRPEAHVNPACDPNVTVRRYHGGGEFGGAHEVTHWMPLPGAPASSVASKEEPTS